MNDSLAKNKKNDSMEENINSMINDLLQEDEMDKFSIKDSDMEENYSNQKKNPPPIININTVQFNANSSKKLLVAEKTMSVNVSKKSNILTTNFSVSGATMISKKKPTLELLNKNNLNNFTNSPRNFNKNFNCPSTQLGNINFNSDFHSNLKTENFHNNLAHANSNHSYETSMKFRSGERFNEQGTNKNYDIWEILENKIKISEKLDEDSYFFFKGNFINIIKAQNGSRILQKSLNKTSAEILSCILFEIKDVLHELMTNSYANYFCQKFYDFLDFREKIIFLSKMKEHIIEVSCSEIGTYPLQAVIDQIKMKEEKKIMILAVTPYVIELCENAQATHVIEKMILCFEEDSIRDIYEDILLNFINLSCHTNGLCVIKKMISCSMNPLTIKRISDLLMNNYDMLLHNQHGNYSIQMAIECWSIEHSLPIMHRLYGQFYNLSMMKFSSNVVEKCLEKGEQTTVSKFMEEICQKSKVMDLMKNPFGNYVIQKALKLSTGFYKNKIIGYIKKSIEKFSDKKLVVKWNNILSNFATKNKLPPKIKLNTSDSNSNNSFTMSNNSPHSACSNNSNNSNISSHSNRPPTYSSLKSFCQMIPFENFQQQPNNIMGYSSFSMNQYPYSSTNSPINYSFGSVKTNFSNNSSNSKKFNEFN